MKNTILLLVFLFSISIQAQNGTMSATDFDFWLGEWELTYQNQNGQTLKAENRIEKILGGAVLQENFNDPNTNFQGKSWSVFNAQTKTWRQTWTDNQGGYLPFTGEKHGDSLVFAMAPIARNGQEIIRRMVFHNIKKDSFNWDWQSAPVGSDKWTQQWQIQYQRKEN